LGTAAPRTSASPSSSTTAARLRRDDDDAEKYVEESARLAKLEQQQFAAAVADSPSFSWASWINASTHEAAALAIRLGLGNTQNWLEDILQMWLLLVATENNISLPPNTPEKQQPLW
jgi:hypothetical protein